MTILKGTVQKLSVNVSAAVGTLPVANGGTGAAALPNSPLIVVATGAVYTLTNAAAAVVFGTTSPTIVIDKAGTYLVQARVKTLYNAATLAANRTVTSKLRRTNNTAADITNGTISLTTDVLTAITGTAGDQTWSCIYTTANADDSISIFSDVSALPSVGSIQVTEASIIAVRLVV